jgi:outer membrane protein insertion porin family
VSVSTNGGFGASIQFSKRNFDIARPATSFADLASGRAWTGAGQEFDILLLPSTEVSQIRVRFREPRFFGSEVAFDMSLYKEFEFRRSYLVDRSGYAVGFSYPVYTNEEETIALIARLGWRHELNDIRDIASDGVPGAFLFDRRRELRGVSGSLTFATVDDFIRPRYETSTTVTAEIVGTFLGGEVDFWSLSANHSETLVVYEDEDGKKHRISTRIGMGLSEPLQDTPEVPPYERFYAGGRTLRGFDYRGVGPHVNGYPTGGEWLLLGSFEYEFPIVARLFSLVAFLDAGTLGTTVHAADAFRWRMSVGGGLRFAIPFLLGDRPLALDFGFPILSEAEDEEQVVSFSLGRNF